MKYVVTFEIEALTIADARAHLADLRAALRLPDWAVLVVPETSGKPLNLEHGLNPADDPAQPRQGL